MFEGISIPEWHKDARCREVDPELFFPDAGEISADARRICASCEVRKQCLQQAIDTNEIHGVWGGLSVRERRRFRSRARVA